MTDRDETREEPREPDEREYVIRFRLPKLPRLLPEEAHGHIMAAQRETLLAVRSMIDACIERMGEPGNPEEKGPTKIEVE